MFDEKLKSDKHIKNIFLKANGKLNALARVTNYMELSKRRILTSASFKAQFNYFPSGLMFHSRSLNNEINRLHELCLLIIYNDKRSSFEELSVKDNSVSVHHNNIHTLITEMHKVGNGMSREVMNDLFKLRDKTHYHLKHTTQFLVHPVHIVFNWSVSASHFGPKI